MKKKLRFKRVFNTNNISKKKRILEKQLFKQDNKWKEFNKMRLFHNLKRMTSVKDKSLDITEKDKLREKTEWKKLELNERNKLSVKNVILVRKLHWVKLNLQISSLCLIRDFSIMLQDWRQEILTVKRTIYMTSLSLLIEAQCMHKL